MKAKLTFVLLLAALSLGGCVYLSNESTPLAQKADYARRAAEKK